MDEQKRLLIALGLVAVVALLMTTLWPTQQPPAQGEQASSATAPADAPPDEPSSEGQDGDEAGDDGDEAGDDGDEAGEAPREVRREIRPEKQVGLKTRSIAVEVTTHGGGVTHAVLLDPQFKDGRGDEAHQIDLVSVDVEERPELLPLSFSLVRRRGSPPAASESPEGQGVLRLINDGSMSAESLAAAADLGDHVASKLAGRRPFATLEDVEETLGGSASGRRGILAKLLTAAWRLGFVRLDFEVLEEGEERLVLRATTDDDIEVIRTIEVTSAHELRISDKLRNRGSSRREVRERLVASGLEKQSGGGFLFSRPTGLLRGLCLHGDDMVRRDRSRLAGDGGGCAGMTGCGGPPGPASRSGDIRFVAVDRHYFMTALSPSESWAGATCDLVADEAGVLQVGLEPVVYTELEPGAHTTFVSTVFFGPKQFGLLEEVGAGRRLSDAIDYGWFAFLSHWLLRALRIFHGWLGNWGLAILFLTFLIKLILLPVSHKTFKNMREMQRDMAVLKPELDAINERYKDQPDLKQQKTLELYNAHGINPLKQVSGCLPMFLQMPIWIALYRMISESVELYRAPFYLWLDDLSSADPYYVLPAVLGVSMFLQQKITPQPGVDNAQAKMMRWMMPGMFLLIMLNMPSGLVLYIFVNTLLTIVQQQFINRMVPAETPTPSKESKSSKDDRDAAGDEATESSRSRRKSRSRRRKRK